MMHYRITSIRTIISKLICTTTPKWQCLGGMCFTCTCLKEVPMQRFNHQEFLGLHRPYSPLLSVKEDDIEHMLWHLPCMDMSWWCAWLVDHGSRVTTIEVNMKMIHCIRFSVSLQWWWDHGSWRLMIPSVDDLKLKFKLGPILISQSLHPPHTDSLAGTFQMKSRWYPQPWSAEISSVLSATSWKCLS